MDLLGLAACVAPRSACAGALRRALGRHLSFLRAPSPTLQGGLERTAASQPVMAGGWMLPVGLGLTRSHYFSAADQSTLLECGWRFNITFFPRMSFLSLGQITIFT